MLLAVTEALKTVSGVWHTGFGSDLVYYTYTDCYYFLFHANNVQKQVVHSTWGRKALEIANMGSSLMLICRLD